MAASPSGKLSSPARGSANGSVAPARGPENHNVARESYLDETRTPDFYDSLKASNTELDSSRAPCWASRKKLPRPRRIKPAPHLPAGERGGTIYPNELPPTISTKGAIYVLAIPGSIVAIEGTNATIDMLGVQRRISISLTPQAQVGDYVLVHAGFAIEVIDAEEARRTIELVRELDELTEEDLAGAEASA